MRVLMLGWEFPPFITGGLGTACAGLTRALARQGTDLTFVLPTEADPSQVSHMTLIAPGQRVEHDAGLGQTDQPRTPSVEHCRAERESDTAAAGSGQTHSAERVQSPADDHDATASHTRQLTPQTPSSGASESPSPIGSAYASGVEAGVEPGLQRIEDVQCAAEPCGVSPGPSGPALHAPQAPQTEAPDVHEGTPPDLDADLDNLSEGHESGELIDQVRRYARFAESATADLDFDCIHAHDWLTWPAALRIARRTGRPLVVHVHSTEFDRSGEHVHPVIHDIERRGMLGAMRVITVSQLTRNIVVERYGVNPDKVRVVYNGVDIDPLESGLAPVGRKEKIILYFGRITRQKGPEFFIRAAARVLELRQDVRFIVAGSGDLYSRCVELAAQLGIGQHFLFTGFLRGGDIQRVFAMADLFVMPSVSEPFGIAPLEAMSHDVPVLISKSSGVSEVLTHALKVDFWDTEAMADRMLAVLRYPPLGRTLRRSGPLDLRRLTWDDAARTCKTTYEECLRAMRPPVR